MIAFINRFFFFALLWAAVGLSSATPAHAQIIDRPSTAEDVAIAFFKTADTHPDFDQWARRTKNFKIQSPVRAPVYLQQEKERLNRVWNKYDPGNATLTVQVKVDVEIETRPDTNGDGPEFWIYINLKQPFPVYFAYNFQEDNFVLLPRDVEERLVQKISAQQFEHIKTDMKGSLKGLAWLTLGLKPYKAYTDKPIEIDAHQAWPLITDIVNLSLASSKTGSPYWYYAADWYVTPKSRELNTLYDVRREKLEQNQTLSPQ